jgi:hypothetical protein
VSEKQQSPKGTPHWPFDPMQPGDHEPVTLPEELERVQKQTGAGGPKEGSPRGDKA